MQRNISRRILGICTMLSLFLALSFTAFAQSDTSSLSGTVTDASGALLPNAKVTVHNNATGAAHSITSDAAGNFTLTNLPSGTYSVRAEVSGFQTTTLTDVRLDPNIGRHVDLAMKVGTATTEV